MPIDKVEMFDADALEGLLRHSGVNEVDKARLRRYKKRRVDGNRVAIHYEHKMDDERFGRLYPNPYIGAATFPHDIRAALSAKFYDDIDIVNCQPVLLCQIAKRQGITCAALEEYVTSRDEVLAAIQQTQKMTRDEAKNVCIATLFGGYRDMHPLLPRICAELTFLSNQIAAVSPLALKAARMSKKKKSVTALNASALAHYVQNEEKEILLTVDRFLQEKGYAMDVLIHDGGHIAKHNGLSIPCEVLREVENAVLDKLGYAVSFIVKPLTHTFDFTHADPGVLPITTIVNDSFAAKKFVEMVGDRIRRCGSEIYCQNDDGIWLTGEDPIRSLIHEYEDRLIWKRDSGVGIRTHDYGGTVSNISKLITQCRVFAKTGELPLQMKYMLTEDDGKTHDEGVDTFLELVRLVCGTDQTLSLYVIQWLAHMLQKPYDLPGVMLILSGQKGVGKDTLFDFLIAHVMGKLSAANYTKNEQFFEKHDTGRKGMFLVKLEEADRKTCTQHASDIKGMVTGTEVVFNGKNEKPVTVPNYTRYVFTTNKGNPVDFRDGERRFVILPCSAERKGDLGYWKKVRECMFNDQVGKAVAQWLLSYDISDFDVRKLPENEYQAEVVEASASAEELFLNAWDGEKLSATEFYKAYQDYCLVASIPQATNITWFGNNMLQYQRDGIVIKSRTSKGVVYSKRGV